MTSRLEENKIASRYARALFEQALEDKSSDDVLEALNQLHEVFSTLPELTRFFLNPGIPKEEKQAFLAGQFGEKKLSPLVVNLLKLMLENGRISALMLVAERYRDFVNEHQNITTAEVVTASPLDSVQEKKLQKALESMFSFNQVSLENRVDPAILGGAIVKIQDQVIDGSFIGKLDALKKRLG